MVSHRQSRVIPDGYVKATPVLLFVGLRFFLLPDQVPLANLNLFDTKREIRNSYFARLLLPLAAR